MPNQMKHISRIVAYITLGIVTVVSGLLYICPLSFTSYTSAVAASVECESPASGMQQLDVLPTAGGCFDSHLVAEDDFIATIPKLLSLLLVVALLFILTRQKFLLLFNLRDVGSLVQMRLRYRRVNRMVYFLFEKKFRIWLILQQRAAVAH